MKRLLSLFMLLLAVGIISAQQLKVTGTVLDKKTNEPIIGASVLVKNTTNGVITDLDGHFELTNVPKGMRGVAIVMITAGLLSLAFMGF